ncbi:MAG: hypothetical protein KF878_24350 [Planctomycetes bacterium]|nr:hypothetical protein [Planctomycetota bacterium]
MSRPGAVVLVLVLGLTCSAAPARAQAEAAQARDALDRVEVEARALKQGDLQPGNALLQRCHQVRQALWAAVGKADAAWAEQLRRCEALDRRIQEVCTGQPKAAAAPDDALRRATGLLDEVERGLAALNPGDVPAANALLTKLEEAKPLAIGSPARASDAWIDFFPRVRDLDRRVRARAAEAAGAAPQGAPRPGERPPAAPKPLSASDGWTLRRDFYPAWDDVAGQLERLPAADLGLARFAEGLRAGIRRMLAAVQAVQEQGHPDVRWCRQRLHALNEALEARIREGVALQEQRRRAAAAAAEDVNGRLRELSEAFDPTTLRCGLEPPYTPERVQAWAADLKRLRQVAASGQAEMERLRTRHPQYARDPAVADMHRRFQHWLPGQVDHALLEATGWAADGARRTAPGRLGDLVARGQTARGQALTDDLLADDAWVTQLLTDLREGAAAADGLRAVARELFGKDDPALGQQAADLRAAAARAEDRAQRALARVRLPGAATSDPRLLQVARDCMAGAPERLVITSLPERKTERRSDSWVEGDYLYTRTWTEEWEEFYVAAAERVGEHHRIVTYVLKFVHRASGMKPEGRWYCHLRLEGQRILPENIAK